MCRDAFDGEVGGAAEAGVLRAGVRVVDQLTRPHRRSGAVSLPGHVEGIQDELGALVGRGRPAHDPA
jgi:hypothetical protein